MPQRTGSATLPLHTDHARLFELPWNHKIEEPGVMDLISVAQVTAKLDELLGQG